MRTRVTITTVVFTAACTTYMYMYIHTIHHTAPHIAYVSITGEGGDDCIIMPISRHVLQRIRRDINLEKVKWSSLANLAERRTAVELKQVRQK